MATPTLRQRAPSRTRPPWTRVFVSVWLPPIISVSLVLLVWELAPRAGLVDPRLVPPISEIVTGVPAIAGDASFTTNVVESLKRWLSGLAVAIVVGVPLGLAMGRSRFVFSLMNPILTFFYATPKAALVVILVLWFGVGLVSLGGVVFLGSLVPIITSAYHGAAEIDPKYEWAARSLGTSRLGLLVRVVFPAALPRVLSGMRIAISLSLLTLLGAEFLVRHRGIGTYLFNSMDLGLYSRMWSVTLLIALTGFVLDFLYAQTMRRTFAWIDGEI